LIGRAWAGLIWLKKWTAGGILWSGSWTSMSHKMRTNSWIAEEWLAFQEALYFVELVIWSAFFNLQCINKF
jgi:hypothetical protein